MDVWGAFVVRSAANSDSSDNVSAPFTRWNIFSVFLAGVCLSISVIKIILSSLHKTEIFYTRIKHYEAEQMCR